MTRVIPSYELYGELLAGGLPGPIHHETIKERSSQHNWTIRFHRHRRLAQIFLFDSPDVYWRLGDLEHTSTDQTVLVVPPGVPHGFRFSENVVGDVVSIRLDEMPARVQAGFTRFESETDTVFSRQQSGNFGHVAMLIGQLREVYHSVVSNKHDLLVALIELMLLYLSADLGERKPFRRLNTRVHAGRHDAMVETFCALLEDNYYRAWSVADYAQRVGISAPHLTRVCRAEIGSAPNDLVRQRRMLEAKRLLEYTALPVLHIANRCGFRDAAFFSRAFKTHEGVSPRAYRKQLDS